jgi:hypothetical protein
VYAECPVSAVSTTNVCIFEVRSGMVSVRDSW